MGGVNPEAVGGSAGWRGRGPEAATAPFPSFPSGVYRAQGGAGGGLDKASWAGLGGPAGHGRAGRRPEHPPLAHWLQLPLLRGASPSLGLSFPNWTPVLDGSHIWEGVWQGAGVGGLCSQEYYRHSVSGQLGVFPPPQRHPGPLPVQLGANFAPQGITHLLAL